MPWKFASFGTLFAALVLAGCSTPQTDKAPVAEGGHGRCEANAAEFAVGKQATRELLEQARTRSGAQTARVLGPHDVVTLEYRSDRLNLNADENAVVTRVNCG